MVVIHDNNLQRLCGKDVKISDLNYDEIPEILDFTLIEFTHLLFYDTKNSN